MKSIPSYVHAGYFSLANKFMAIYKDSLSSRNWQRRISKFAQYDKDIKRYTLSTPLIGQMQAIVGGKIVYLECEDKPKLLDFYGQNGFVSFGKRPPDRDETTSRDGEYLIQMLTYTLKSLLFNVFTPH